MKSHGFIIVWEMPLRPNGEITEYEIQFFVPDTEQRIIRSRNREGTFYTVQDQDSLAGPLRTFFRVRQIAKQVLWWLLIGREVQVRAITSAGAGIWSKELPLGILLCCVHAKYANPALTACLLQLYIYISRQRRHYNRLSLLHSNLSI